MMCLASRNSFTVIPVPRQNTNRQIIPASTASVLMSDQNSQMDAAEVAFQ